MNVRKTTRTVRRRLRRLRFAHNVAINSQLNQSVSSDVGLVHDSRVCRLERPSGVTALSIAYRGLLNESGVRGREWRPTAPTGVPSFDTENRVATVQHAVAIVVVRKRMVTAALSMENGHVSGTRAASVLPLRLIGDEET